MTGSNEDHGTCTSLINFPRNRVPRTRVSLDLRIYKFVSLYLCHCIISLLNMESRFQLFVLCSMLFSPLAHGHVVSSREKDTTSCQPGVNCKLPNCFCSGTKIPNGLSAKDIPQIIMVTFDDAVNEQVFTYEEAIVNGGIKNPNGCNITTTYFNSHEWTDYFMLHSLYHQRQEIADHTITHRTPTSWWKEANYTQWDNEIWGQKEIQVKWGQVAADDVKGFRAPFLQVGGNNQFKVLHDRKFLYDSSMPTRQMKPPMWPYTLDFQTTQECNIPPCPTDPFPGLWEVPLVDYTDPTGALCAMIDACRGLNTADDVYNMLMDNFKRHYMSTKAPFPMFTHAAWFMGQPFRLDGVLRFLKEVSSHEDVWIVGVSQAVAWIQNPTTLDKIKDFLPWRCDGPAPAPCDEKVVCGPYPGHYLHMCRQPCPKNYPWYGNPYGN